MRRVALVLAVMALVLLLASGVAWAVTKVGTNVADFLRGTNGSDKLVGKGGNDWILGRAGKDVINGGPGSEGFVSYRVPIGEMSGGRGADVISGGPGDDYAFGGGADVILGGPGDDSLDDQLYADHDSAVDRLVGGDGDDYITSYNVPASRDIIICGAGRDDAGVDRKDIVTNDCEFVEVVR